MIIFCLIFCLLTILYYYKKNLDIKNSKVVLIDRNNKIKSSLLLANYGIVTQLRQNNKIGIITPDLNQLGQLTLNLSWHNIFELQKPSISRNKNNIQYQIAQAIADFVVNNYQVEQEIADLVEQYHQINELIQLVSTSELYGEQLRVYQRAIRQIDKILDVAQELQKNYIILIREALISLKITNYNPAKIKDNRLPYFSQCKQLQADYQFMKDIVKAYTNLIYQQY